jgi:hypothetical protein
MDGAWQTLLDGGLPLAAARTDKPGAAPSARQLAVALRGVIAVKPAGREGEALAAFVFAWQAHFRTSFAAEVGADAAEVLAFARERATDAGRYLKLRRIAVENLSRVL